MEHHSTHLQKFYSFIFYIWINFCESFVILGTGYFSVTNFSNIITEWLSWLHWVAFKPLWGSLGHICVGPFLEPQSYYGDPHCLLLSTEPLQEDLKLGIGILLVLFFFKIVLVILGLLDFHGNFRIGLLYVRNIL